MKLQMSTQTAKSQLMKATKALLLHWDQATEHWDDPVSRKIEIKHIEPLRDAVKAAVGGMETMGETIARAQNECT